MRLRRRNQNRKMRKIHYLIFIFVFTIPLEINAQGDEGFIYNDHEKRDPFWPLVSPSGTILSYDKDLLISEISLEGIMTDPQGRNVAIINGTVLKQGDNIGLFEITAITKTQVTLKKGQEQAVLDLNKGGEQ